MAKILCTWSGKYGDILWSLPTVQQISRNAKQAVYMGIMPQYKSILSLLNSQPYIQHAFAIDEWVCSGSPHGDQPWCPQNHETLKWQYDEIHHLTYRMHPAPGNPLIDFIARAEGITLQSPIPFIEEKEWWLCCENDEDKKLAENRLLNNAIAYCFNPMYKEPKDKFLEVLQQKLPNYDFIRTDKLSWRVAASVMRKSLAFVGCRSSQYALAVGVGQSNIFIYEPHPHRHHQGVYGTTFSCPYVNETCGPLVTTPEVEADRAAQFIHIWQTEKEKQNALVES